MPAAERCQSGDSSAGFSLLELLTVLAIISAVLLTAVPGFRNYLHAQQVNSSATQFLFALNLARSEAMQRGRRVDVAARDGKQWENGWIVFVHQNARPLPPPGSDDLLYSHTPGIPALRVFTRLTDRATPYIAYNGYGRTHTNTSAYVRQTGSLQFSVADQTRLIVIEKGARARLCNPLTDRSCTAFGDTDEESAPQENTP